MSAPNHFVATTASFMADVVQASTTIPVLVDFWAPWCGPCRQLMPILDRLVAEYDGRFQLAKVNTDEEQALAGQLGIRSLPTVVLFKDGAPVDHFMGVVPEREIRAMLDRHVPAAATSPLAEVRALKAAGDFTAARSRLELAFAHQPGDVDLLAELGELQALADDLEGARDTLEQIRASDPQHAGARRLAAAIVLRDVIAASPDADALAERLRTHPADVAARHALAAHDLLAGRYESALGAWLEIMRTHPGYRDGLARRSLVQAFDLIGESDPVVTHTRREMAKLLF